MVTYKKIPTPGDYSPTIHGYHAWQDATGDDTTPFKEWLRLQAERENLFTGIWKMVIRLSTEDLRKVYHYIRTLSR